MRQSRRWFLRGMALPNMAPGLRANGNLSIRSIKISLLHTLWEASCAHTAEPRLTWWRSFARPETPRVRCYSL